MRQTFARVPDHPMLAGLDGELTRLAWRGHDPSPRLPYELRPRYGPTVHWCGMPVTRLWRCGNRGNVASVLIEKPARGDFLSILDGGYGLQYSALIEYREGQGVVIFARRTRLDAPRPTPLPGRWYGISSRTWRVGNRRPSQGRLFGRACGQEPLGSGGHFGA